MTGVTLSSVDDKIGLLEAQMEHLRLSPNSNLIRESLYKRGVKEEIPLLTRQIRLEQETMNIYKKQLKELIELRDAIIKQMCRQSK